MTTKNKFPMRLLPMPSFAEIASPTWRALEAFASDPATLDRVNDVIATAGSFVAPIAAPRIAAALRKDAVLTTHLRGADPDHLAVLLIALVNVGFEMRAGWFVDDGDPVPQRHGPTTTS